MSKNSIPIKDLPLYIKQLCLQLQKMDYSESTCRRTRTVLKQYCDFAVDNGMVEYDSFSVQKFVISKSGDNFQDVYHSYRYNRPFSMLDDFIRTGTIFRQKYRSTCGFEGSYANLFQSYLVNLIYIRDFLGHVDVKTTQIYARADVTLKRKAIEAANVVETPQPLRSWTDDDDLMRWLFNLGKF